MPVWQSCKKQTVSQRLEVIDNLIYTGDFSTAREECCELYNQLTTHKHPTDLHSCYKLAINFVILADNDTSSYYEDDIACAVNLFKQANLAGDGSLSNIPEEIYADYPAACELLNQLCNNSEDSLL